MNKKVMQKVEPKKPQPKQATPQKPVQPQKPAPKK